MKFVLNAEEKKINPNSSFSHGLNAEEKGQYQQDNLIHHNLAEKKPRRTRSKINPNSPPLIASSPNPTHPIPTHYLHLTEAQDKITCLAVSTKKHTESPQINGLHFRSIHGDAAGSRQPDQATQCRRIPQTVAGEAVQGGGGEDRRKV